MKLLEQTLEAPKFGPEANIALDEALLEAAEAGETQTEILRLWTPSQPIVVLGRSSPHLTEVNLKYCLENEIPFIRRCSGGASIVTADGCLMYAVLLDYRLRPHLRMLEQAHRFVMGKLQTALSSMGIETKFQGTCDLTIDNRKFSGNALRCKKNWMIYHGTMICREMETGLISRCLGNPKRQPDYRAGRTHSDFVTRLPCSVDTLSNAIQNEWGAVEPLEQWPEQRTVDLVDGKYSKESWNKKL